MTLKDRQREKETENSRPYHAEKNCEFKAMPI